MDPDPARDNANHTLAILTTTIDPIHQSSLESDSKGNREVCMVGPREELLEKIVEEIQREANEEIAQAAHLAKDAKKGKRHNNL
jgi:hypothetical protein